MTGFRADYSLSASELAHVSEYESVICLRLATEVKNRMEYSLILRPVATGSTLYKRIGYILRVRHNKSVRPKFINDWYDRTSDTTIGIVTIV